jgi:hypothetical protein
MTDNRQLMANCKRNLFGLFRELFWRRASQVPRAARAHKNARGKKGRRESPAREKQIILPRGRISHSVAKFNPNFFLRADATPFFDVITLNPSFVVHLQHPASSPEPPVPPTNKNAPGEPRAITAFKSSTTSKHRPGRTLEPDKSAGTVPILRRPPVQNGTVPLLHRFCPVP